MRIFSLRIQAVILALFLFFVSSWVTAGEFFSPPEMSEVKTKAGADKCVEPVEVMRRRHMSFLKHQRNHTMYQGIRTSKYSFVGCINCHVSPNSTGTYPSIKSQAHFCTGCHTYAAVHIDCFQCHASKPETVGTSHE